MKNVNFDLSNEIIVEDLGEMVICINDDMDRLNQFFEENLLEISDAEPVETNVIESWKLIDKKEGNLLGGCCLAFRENEYIIDGIAIDSSLRKMKLGEKLLNIAKDEVRKRGGKSIFLVAKAPLFFQKHGFQVIGQDGAPLFYECAGCEQFNISCFPKIMKWEDKI